MYRPVVYLHVNSCLSAHQMRARDQRGGMFLLVNEGDLLVILQP